MRNILLTIAVLLAALPLPSLSQGTPIPTVQSNSSTFVSVGTASAVPGLHARDQRYKLRKGDSFDLDFQLSPEFNQTVVVGPDGFVTLREAGSMHAEGQTLPELTDNVKAAYATILHDPVLSIVLKDFDKPYFIASGELAKPGKYDLRGPLTVTEAVAIAGGFSQNAKHSQVVLFRPNSNGVFEAKLLNLKKLLASRNLSEDIFLEPGDLVYVPKSAFSSIRPYIPTASMGAFYNPALF